MSSADARPRVRPAVAVLARASAVLVLALGVGVSGVPAHAAAHATAPDAASAASTVRPASTIDTTAEQGEVSLTLSPADRGLVGLDQELVLQLELTNATDTEVPASSVAVFVDRRLIADSGALDTWTSGEGTPLGVEIGSVDVPAVLPAASVVAEVRVSAETLAFTDQTSFGARRIWATASTTDGDLATDRSTITVTANAAPAAVSVTSVVPIVAPRREQGLIPADELEELTDGAGSPLSSLLASVTGRAVAVAVDPAIVASIRVLGDAAPDSAVAWLNRLEALPNETFPLAYGDADLAAMSQGLGELVRPESFGFALDDTATAPSATSTPDPSSTPTPDATGAPSTAEPTTEQVLAMSWTRMDVAWPLPGTATTDDLARFADAGLTSTLLAGDDVEPERTATTQNAVTALGDRTAIVADDALSAAYTAAATATTDAAWAAAVADLTAVLATVVEEDPDAARSLLLTLDRPLPGTATRLAATADAVGSLDFVTAGSLEGVIGAPAASGTLTTTGLDAERLDAVRALGDAWRAERAFATIAENPVAVTAPRTDRLLGLLSAEWATAPQLAADERAQFLEESQTLRASVQVLDQSQLNLYAESGEMPVNVRNDLDSPVTVFVTIRTSTSSLAVVGPRRIEVDLAADSVTRVQVPVRAVANGSLAITATLTSASGAPIGTPVVSRANVNAEWETYGTIILSVAMVLLLAVGVVRTVLRRRARRAVESTTSEPGSTEEPS